MINDGYDPHVAGINITSQATNPGNPSTNKQGKGDKGWDRERENKTVTPADTHTQTPARKHTEYPHIFYLTY